MRSLILKDLYNIGHNAKSMLFILVVLAVVFLPSEQGDGYMFLCAILCSMMVVTTFNFDENSKWERYAMVTPVSKKDLVAAKYVVLMIFCGIGSVFGGAASFVGGVLIKHNTYDTMGIFQLVVMILVAFVISVVYGSMTIPLIFKFGPERARMLLLVSILVPTLIGYGIYKILLLLGVLFTDKLILILLCLSPLIAIAWCGVMYLISYSIFKKRNCSLIVLIHFMQA